MSHVSSHLLRTNLDIGLPPIHKAHQPCLRQREHSETYGGLVQGYVREREEKGATQVKPG